jgi:mxaK protein
MGLSARCRKVLTVAAAVLCGFAAAGLWQLMRMRAWNALATSAAAVSAPDDSPANVRLAKAHALAGHGDFLTALALYRQVAAEGDATRRAAATFNEGNLLLREGLALRAAGDNSRALPLLELAKESYRRLLQDQPQDWDAKYNLELALRWAPEPEDEEAEAGPPPLDVRRSAIIKQALPQGLP